MKHHRSVSADWKPQEWPFTVEYDPDETWQSVCFVAVLINGIILGFGLEILFAWTR